MSSFANANGRMTLHQVARCAVAALLAKILASILIEYRWYFPPNFEAAAFLIGRRDIFTQLYSIAFYAHITAGPVVIVLGAFLMLSSERPVLSRQHAWAGRLLTMIVLGVLAPSGLVMAYWAHVGPAAGWGFASLAVATAVAATVAAEHARTGRFHTHRKWAVRCFILLCSPLLLRLATGCAIVLGLESEWFYIGNAWLSWLIPLTIYETVRRVPASSEIDIPLPDNPPVAS